MKIDGRAERFANEVVDDDGHPCTIYDIPIDGLFQVKWPNGNLRYEWYYKDGKRADGISKGWFPNGKLKQTMSWKNCNLSGGRGTPRVVIALKRFPVLSRSTSANIDFRK